MLAQESGGSHTKSNLRMCAGSAVWLQTRCVCHMAIRFKVADLVIIVIVIVIRMKIVSG